MSTISLICSTLGNRIYELERLLSSIKESLFQKEVMQIIVVNQNPNSQDILPLINRYKNDLNLMVINQAEKGLSKGRNYGFEFSEGDIIAFSDDDCWFPPDFFINLFNVFELYSADIILGSIHDLIKDIVYPGNKKYNGKNVNNAMIFLDSKPTYSMNYAGSGLFDPIINFLGQKDFIPIHNIGPHGTVDFIGLLWVGWGCFSIIVLALLGFLIGFAYKRFTLFNTLRSDLLYAIIFPGIISIIRINYFFLNLFIYSFILYIIIDFLLDIK